MAQMLSGFRRPISYLLSYVIALNSLVVLCGSAATVQAQDRRIIVVNAEQPNLWTLEQAHYLLAQMHRRNLDLKTKSVGELDPNEIAGLRFDVMRMLIEFGATFNQADLETNRLLSENRTFNAERRQELMTERDSLRRQALRLTGEIEELENEKARTEDEDEQKRIDARIAAKNTRLARVDKESEQLNEELKTLTAPSGDPKATTGGATFDPNKLPKSDFDEAFKDAAKKQIEKFNASPQLNASLRLDNFLQMQYEIISKQLALLRDELGPGERLVFLELPQTVNAAHHESENKWAQSWWKIGGYTHRVRRPHSEEAVPDPPTSLKRPHPPITVTQDMNSILDGTGIRLPLAPAAPAPTPIPCVKVFGVTNAIRIEDTPASPKPHPLNVDVKMTGKVTNVKVTLLNLRHPFPDVLDVMLVGPQGQNAIIMSDVGGATLADGVDIMLDDSYPNSLPDNAALTSGGFKPTNISNAASPDNFPADSPVPLGGSALSVFNDTNPNGTWSLYLVNGRRRVSSLSGGWQLEITTDCPVPPPPPSARQVAYDDRFEDLDAVHPNTILSNYLNDAENPRSFENRMVRTVELIPRQSSLNVNDMDLKVKAGAFNFVLSTLFGFGSSLNIQRQREQFSQFVQQELYSAAFGKGSREFGWTFTPMPGTHRLHSGVRTTYAVVVVPENATSLVMEANGCYFPRSYYPPNNFFDTKSERWNRDNRTSRNCGGQTTKAFVVPIPSARVDGGNEFWIDRISFQPVDKGKRVVVSIGGKNFSPQTGILIDGMPLVQSIGLAQPLLRDDSDTGRLANEDLKDQEVQGRIERVDTEKVIFSFKMPSDYQGTPTITMIAPGRAIDVNDLDLDINHQGIGRLREYKTKMFGNTPDPAAFRIDRVKVFRASATLLSALVNGDGLATTQRVFMNGQPVAPANRDIVSNKLIRLTFSAPEDPSIRITLVSGPPDTKTVESEPVANPSFLSVSDVEVLVYEAATEDEPAMVVVKITGTGFTDNLTTSIGKIAVKSATEAILTLANPTAAAFVTLRDSVTKQQVKVVVTRKSKPAAGP